MLVKIKEWLKKIIEFVVDFKAKIIIGLAVIGGVYLLLKPLYLLVIVALFIAYILFLYKKNK